MATATVNLDKDYERIFASNFQRDILHFYGLGDGIFSAGYMTPDGVYHSGLWRYDGETFREVSASKIWHVVTK